MLGTRTPSPQGLIRQWTRCQLQQVTGLARLGGFLHPTLTPHPALYHTRRAAEACMWGG
jgi:hypothetical protein